MTTQRLPDRVVFGAVALCSLLASGTALADGSGITTRFSGFGSAIGAFTNTDDTEFRNSPVPSNGVGKSLDIGNDSKLGLQGTIGFGNDITVTGQLLAKREATEDFKPGVEWFYVQYSGIPGLDLRLGRTALPAFLISESRDVGYAQTTLRVPTFVYGLLPFTSIDGAQANYRHNIGDAVVSVQGSYGKTSLESSGNGTAAVAELSARNVGGLNATVEWGSWTARIGQVKSTWSSAGEPGLKDDFRGYGLQYDNGTAIVVGEFVKRSTTPSFLNSQAWYVTAGWRFDKWTPYTTYQRYNAKSAFGPPGAPLPPAADGESLGLRYDVAANIALKTDFSRLDSNHPTNFTTQLMPRRKIDVASVGVDFVF